MPRYGGIVDEFTAPYALLKQYPYFGQVPSDAVKYGINGIFRLGSPTAIKLALQKGPVIGGMKTNILLCFYGANSGIYSHVPIYNDKGVEIFEPGKPNSQPGGHAILIVGYDDAQGCWICKNSWGTGWGESGFFRVKYGNTIRETYDAYLISVPVMITGQSPRSGQKNVALESAVRITFGEPLKADTVSPTSFVLNNIVTGQAVAGALSLENENRSAVFTPAEPLASGTAYSFRVTTDVKSTDGDTIAKNENWAFYTVGYLGDVPPVAAFVEKPDNPTSQTTGYFEIGGIDLSHFKYSLDGKAFTSEMPISQPLELTGLADGKHTLRVIGRKTNGIWQAESDAASYSWVISTKPSYVSFTLGPLSPTTDRKPVFSVRGNDVTAIRLNRDNNGWSGWFAVSNNAYEEFVFNAEFAPGTHTLKVVGRNSLNVEQPLSEAAVYTWVIDDVYLPNAILFDVPPQIATETSVNATVGGAGIVKYRYRLDTDAYSSEIQSSQAISLSGLGIGTHTLSVLGMTANGYWQSAAAPTKYSWRISPPVVAEFVAMPMNPSSVAQAEFVFGGTGIADFRYKRDQGSWKESGSKLNLVLPNDASLVGTHTLAVIGKNSDGFWQDANTARSYSWFVNPNMPVTAQIKNAPPKITSQCSVSLSVGGERISAYKYKLDSAEYSAIVPASATIDITNLPPGGHTLQILGIDVCGKLQPEDAPTVFTWVIDIEPNTAVLMNLPPALTNANVASITVGGAGVIAFKYQLDGNAWSVEQAVSQPITLTGLSVGSHTLRVLAKDDASNWQASSSATLFTWMIDTIAKMAVLSNTPPALTNQTTASITVGGTGVVGYMYQLDTGAYSSEMPVTSTIQLADLTVGSHTLRVIARDAVGNWQASSSATLFTWMIDTVAPVALLTTKPADPTNLTTTDITIYGNGVTAYQYQLDGGGYATETAIASHIQLSALGEGAHTINVIARDEAGNWQLPASSTNVTWTIDTVAPTAVISGPPASVTYETYTPPEFKIEGVDVVSYKARVDAEAWSAETQVSQGPGYLNLAYGSHIFEVIGKDAAGNWQASATTYSWTIQSYYDSQWGSAGTENGQFNLPTAIATDSANNIYVADGGNNRIQKFDAAGAYLGQWGSEGSDVGSFSHPVGIAIDAADNKYVLDFGNRRIQKFDASDAYVTQWALGASAQGWGLAVASSGNVLVSDTYNNIVTVYDATGTQLFEIGSGLLLAPAGIAITSAGHILVADSGNKCIKEFDSSGNFIQQIKNDMGVNGFGKFDNPNGIAVLPNGNLLVADASHNSVHPLQELTATGTFIRAIARPGTGLGELNGPLAVLVGAGNKIYVVDTENHRIQIFN